MKQEPAAQEFNFDGLVGPTHNYAGLALGNIASQQNAGLISNPKAAAKQGLDKMRMLMNLGVPQAVLPPHQRPNLQLIREHGPEFIVVAYSAASMWTANMATVSPSCDTVDRKVHITPANLYSNLHRAQEAEFSYKLLQKIFPDQNKFAIHPPLPASVKFADEGAANHSILCADYGAPGLELFVYGVDGKKFKARQSETASKSYITNHDLDPNKVLILQQNPQAIDAGVFHNDVIFVANKNVLLYHAQAFIGWSESKKAIQKFFSNDCYCLEITDQELSLDEAVATYLFNSQIVSLPDKSMSLIAPIECQKSPRVKTLIESLIAADNPIKSVHYLDLLQSMRNGGGPACLRLRVILTKDQQQAMQQKIIFSEELYQRLDAWVDTHYRDKLSAKDFLDPLFKDEVFIALDELTQLLDLGAIYPFQQIP